MRVKTRLFSKMIVVLSLILAGAPAAFSQSELVRWDIISVAFATPPAGNTISPGGVAYAKTIDGLKIKLTGSGTFLSGAAGLGKSGAVTGGGTWETFSPTGVSLASGTYAVTEVLIYEFTNYQTGTTNIDNVGNPAEAANGIAVLRIDYLDGSKGVLTVECHGFNAPAGISEGVTATKGYTAYDRLQDAVPNVNENRTVYHRGPILITGLTFNPGPSVSIAGGSFSAAFAGPNLTSETFFDVRFRAPGSTVDQAAFNWQKGTSASHPIPMGTPTGTWTVTGVRAHLGETDHTGSYTTVSVTLTVTQ